MLAAKRGSMVGQQKIKNMNCYKELDLVRLKTKSQWWRIGLILALIVTFGIVNFGCDNKNDDEYYVKYVIQSSSGKYISSRYAQINSENNTEISFTFRNSPWEMTIGPVKKGFNAKLKAGFNSAGNVYEYSINAEIHVSKNDAPFGLKKSNYSNTARTSVEINYTID